MVSLKKKMIPSMEKVTGSCKKLLDKKLEYDI